MLAIWRQLLFTNPNLDRFEARQNEYSSKWMEFNSDQPKSADVSGPEKKVVHKTRRSRCNNYFSIILKLKQAWNYFRLKPHVMTLTFSNVQIVTVAFYSLTLLRFVHHIFFFNIQKAAQKGIFSCQLKQKFDSKSLESNR